MTALAQPLHHPRAIPAPVEPATGPLGPKHTDPAAGKKKPKPCRYCKAGNVANDGDHWIVKSIFPPAIDLRKCTAVEADR